MIAARAHPDPRARAWMLHAATLVAAALFYRAAWPTLPQLTVSVDHCVILFQDFVAHYAPTGRELLQTKQASLGLHYSALFALAMWALMQLPWAAALWLWAFLQLAAAALLFALTSARLTRGARSRAAASAGYLLLLLTSFPLLHNFAWGQVSVFATLCAFASLDLQERRRPGLAGLVLAAGIAIKYYPAIVLVWFVLRRDLRAVVLTGAWTAVLLVAVPAPLLGLEPTLRFYDIGGDLEGAAHALRADPNSQYFAHVFARLVGTGAPLRYAGWAIAAATLLLVRRLAKRGGPQAGDRALAALLLSLPFLLPTSWPHYFVFLPPCQLLVLRRARHDLAGAWRGAALALLGTSAALASAPFFRAVGDHVAYAAAGWLLWADIALLAALWLVSAGDRAAPTGA